MRGSISYQYCY